MQGQQISTPGVQTAAPQTNGPQVATPGVQTAAPQANGPQVATPPPDALQPVAGGDQPQPATEDEQPAPAIDPKTGLPPTPADQRDKEIDKYDPLKRSEDPTGAKISPLTDRELPKAITNQDKTEPLPGSVAASSAGPATSGHSGNASQDASTSGDQTSSDSQAGADANGQEYTGPAVLSRSYTLARPMVPTQIRWRVSLGFNESLDIGQNPVIANPDGTYPSTTTASDSIAWSLSGRHIWKHDQLGLSYLGNYSYYNASAESLSGMNNSLNLDYQHVVSRRITLQLVESLSLLSQNYSLENPTLAPGSSVANIDLATSPNLQILDNTVRQSSSTASLTFRKTNRLSFDASLSYFMVDRSGSGLIGTTGSQAGGDVNYRMTRKATVGAYYSYTSYRYSHDVLQSGSYGMGLIYSYALSRSTQVRTRFGATHVASLGYETVPLPPDLAAILGQTATVVNAYSANWISDVSVELVRDFRRSRTASLAFARGESPGNGLLLTSVQETVSAGYSALVLKHLPVSSGVMYSSLTSTAQGNLGFYRSETVYLSTSHALRHGWSTTLRFDYRRYDISGTPLLQSDFRISLGVAWSPPEDSLRF